MEFEGNIETRREPIVTEQYAKIVQNPHTGRMIQRRVTTGFNSIPNVCTNRTAIRAG